VVLSDPARLLWISTHILPLEGEVRGWLRRHVHSLKEGDADDLIQESYARLWEADFSTIVNGRSYFYAVIRNLMIEHAKRARIVPMERLGEIEALRIPSEEPGPEHQVSARQELERLLAIVDRLPDQCQRAFRLQKFHGCSQKEIAEEMKISEKTVEKHLSVALLRVVEALRQEEMETTGVTSAKRHDRRQQEQPD
jgi:RNA polymerase sigma factor (sigma-70 family)